MEVEIVKREISVYGLCSAQGALAYVGRWARGTALEFMGRVVKEVDYEWWKSCVYARDRLYLFGYRGGVMERGAESAVKKTKYLGSSGVAYDGKVFYVVGDGGLYVLDGDLRLVKKVDVKGLRDVAIGSDGTVYVLGERVLYVYEEGLKPVYKLSRDALIGYYVVPHDDGIYVSSLTQLVRLDRNFRERAFTPIMSRSFAILGDYVVSAYDDVVATAYRDTLSVTNRRRISGLSAGTSKMLVERHRALAPVYFGNEAAVLALSV